MKEPKTQIKRRFEIPTSKVLGLLTEEVETKKAILRYGTDAIEVQKHILTNKVTNLMEKAGIEIEWIPESRHKGMSNISGVPVKISPINKRSYESGAVVIVFEDRATSWENTNKITNYLSSNGIDTNNKKECRLFGEDLTCMIKK